MLGTRNGRIMRVRASLILLALCLLSGSAHAYPWMIRHHYTSCSACHFDPSGAGPITGYGRAVADGVIRMNGTSEGAADLPTSAGFLFGAIRTPEWLELGGDVRLMSLTSKTTGIPATNRLIWMQLDTEATIHVSGFVASGTLGFAPEGALGATLTRGTENNLVSRQHWIG